MTTLDATFSFGRDRDLLRRFEDTLGLVCLHDLHSDVDANRTWASISGQPGDLAQVLINWCEAAFERIDLTRHVSPIPRTGALDAVCCHGEASSDLARDLGAEIAERFGIPVYGQHRADAWAALQAIGFGSLEARTLHPDFGPTQVHPALGICLVARRERFLRVSIDLSEERAEFAGLRARDVQNRRWDGDPLFLGVEALAFPAPSDGVSRLLFEFSDPDVAPPDPVLEWVTRRSKGAGIAVGTPRMIGAIRQVDLLETRSIPIRPAQVIRE